MAKIAVALALTIIYQYSPSSDMPHNIEAIIEVKQKIVPK